MKRRSAWSKWYKYTVDTRILVFSFHGTSDGCVHLVRRKLLFGPHESIEEGAERMLSLSKDWPYVDGNFWWAKLQWQVNKVIGVMVMRMRVKERWVKWSVYEWKETASDMRQKMYVFTLSLPKDASFVMIYAPDKAKVVEKVRKREREREREREKVRKMPSRKKLCSSRFGMEKWSNGEGEMVQNVEWKQLHWCNVSWTHYTDTGTGTDRGRHEKFVCLSVCVCVCACAYVMVTQLQVYRKVQTKIRDTGQ